MRALLYQRYLSALIADLRHFPGKWLSRLVFLLGPWAVL